MPTQQIALDLAPRLPISGNRIPRARAYYEGGSTGTRRTSTWRAPTATPNAGVLANLTTLRNRSRQAVRNDGIAKSAIDHLVTNIIGTGITLRSKAVDKAFRRQANELFEAWAEYADANGMLDWYGIQTQATRSWLEGGDAFVRIRLRQPGDDLPVALQLEVLESEFCPHDHHDFTKRIRAGIEYSPIGKRLAYYFYKSRPELDDMDMSQLVRVPAESVVHLYDPSRPGQMRGVPVLTQALIKLYELDKFDDATLLRQQIGNMFAGFVKTPASTTEPFLNPLSGVETKINAADDKPYVSLEPATIQELDPGTEITFATPPGVDGSYAAFMRQQLRGVSAATGVPYEVLTGDMSGLNDRVMRVILAEFRRRIMAIQYQIVGFQLGRRVWQAFMDRAFLSGALPIGPDYVTNRAAYAAVDWAPHSWPYLHPVQDVEATEKAIRIGLTSRAAAVAEQGEDVEDVDAQQAEDNARADELGLKYDSDGRQAKNAVSKPVADEGKGQPQPAPQGAAA
jgi:lambda family phage portal protein